MTPPGELCKLKSILRLGLLPLLLRVHARHVHYMSTEVGESVAWHSVLLCWRGSMERPMMRSESHCLNLGIQRGIILSFEMVFSHNC